MDKLEGQEIKLGGKTYIMPDLPYGAYEDMDAMVKLVSIARSLDAMNGNPLLHPLAGNTLKESRELVTVSLQENYPELKEEDLKKGLHPYEIVTAISLLLNREFEIQKLVEIDRKNAEPQPKAEEAAAKANTKSQKN